MMAVTISTHRNSWEMRLRQGFQIFTIRLLTEALGRPPTRGQQISLEGLQHHEGVLARRTPQAFRSLKAVSLGSRWKQFGMRSKKLDLTAAA
jgi:hypothetical protein